MTDDAPWNRDDIGFDAPGVVANYDELPLWSAPLGQLILDRVPLRPDLTVLDVGCGTGFLSIELAQRCGPRSTVIAVDPWAGAIAALRAKIDYLGLRNVVVQERDAAHLDRAEASVDVVVSNLGINNFDHAADVLRECRRVLRRDGSLLMTSNLVGHMAEFYAVFRATLQELDRADLVRALDEHVAHRATPGSLTSLLGSADFRVDEVVTSDVSMRFASGTALFEHYFIRLGFLPAWRDVVDPPSRDVVFPLLRERLDQLAAAEGELRLTVPIALVRAS